MRSRVKNLNVIAAAAKAKGYISEEAVGTSQMCRKNRGGLFTPSWSTIEICRVTERVFLEMQKEKIHEILHNGVIHTYVENNVFRVIIGQCR